MYHSVCIHVTFRSQILYSAITIRLYNQFPLYNFILCPYCLIGMKMGDSVLRGSDIHGS